MVIARQAMARRHDGRTFNISVVGLSGTEKDKGTVGVGKSCLCNRFVRPLADDYETDHISVLSQSDFGGCVVNNDHFLYWGEAVKTNDDGQECVFQVIEQTEFIDDSSFQPFKSGKTEPYFKRCAALRVQSAEKLAYICKNQLGLEHEFDQQLLPDGRFAVDGFLCVFDVSHVAGRLPERQLDFVSNVLNNLVRTKKPVVLVTTKNDLVQESYVREIERLLSRKEFKHVVIPVVESSAHRNVNVDAAFLTLASLIEKIKGRPVVKSLSYLEAFRIRKEQCDALTDAYWLLLRRYVTDYCSVSWKEFEGKAVTLPDFVAYCDSFGTDYAKKLFDRHIRQLHMDSVKQKKEFFLQRLSGILGRIFPDLAAINDRSWSSIMRWLPNQDFFVDFFVEVEDGLDWHDVDIRDNRIPFVVLEDPAAENMFISHSSALRQEEKRAERCRQFQQLLEENDTVCAGKTLSEVAIFFIGRECFSSLSEEDKSVIYERHQKELRHKAKHVFLELILQNASLFFQFIQQKEAPTVAQLNEIIAKFQPDPRLQGINLGDKDMMKLLHDYITFVQSPSPDRCPFADRCMETLMAKILADKARRPQSWNNSRDFHMESHDNRLNIILLGCQGLTTYMLKEIRGQCFEDKYKWDNRAYNMDYRLIDGDVTLPQYSFRTTTFCPNGLLCLFNNAETLDYLKTSLQNTLIADPNAGGQLPFHGLPVVLVLANDATLTEKRLSWIRDEGQQLADRLQCPFIDLPSSLMVNAEARFHVHQVQLALHALVETINHQSALLNPWQLSDSMAPDIRILMTFMCGDSFNIEIPLGPLLNQQCCYVTSDRYPSLTLETYLDDSKRKVEVTLISYHGAMLTRSQLYHGFLLVYSPKRKASLENAKAFGKLLGRVPKKLLAICEDGVNALFPSGGASQNLITEGNAVADRLGASFTTTGPNFHLLTAVYTPFFKDVWHCKSTTEQIFNNFAEPRLPIVSNRGSLHLYSNAAEPLYDYLVPVNLTASGQLSSHESPPQPALDKAQPPFRYDAQLAWNNDSDVIVDRHNRSPYGTTTFQSHNQKPKTTLPTSSAAMKMSPITTSVEIGSDYAQVLDCLPTSNDDMDLDDYVYTSVHDALPQGHRRRVKLKPGLQGTTSESDCESLDAGAEEPRYELCERQPIPSFYDPSLPAATVDDMYQLLPLQRKLSDIRASQSLSEESVNASDKTHLTKKLHKKRFFHKKFFDTSTLTEQLSNLHVPATIEAPRRSDDMYIPLTTQTYDEDAAEPTDARKWNRLWRLPEKSKGKDDKTSKVEGRQKPKEEEKRARSQKKQQSKKKKDGPRQAMNLSDTVRYDDQIPVFVRKCINFLDEEGISTEGIYRVPGNKAHVDLLLEKFNEDPEVDWNALEIPVNAVATALKGFFSELAEPLIPSKVCNELLQAVVITDATARLIALKEVIHRMPLINVEVLKQFISHVFRITQNSEENKMDARNMATCLWPTILRPEYTSFENMSQNCKLLEEIIYIIIIQSSYIFSDESLI